MLKTVHRILVQVVSKSKLQLYTCSTASPKQDRTCHNPVSSEKDQPRWSSPDTPTEFKTLHQLPPQKRRLFFSYFSPSTSMSSSSSPLFLIPSNTATRLTPSATSASSSLPQLNQPLLTQTDLLLLPQASLHPSPAPQMDLKEYPKAWRIWMDVMPPLTENLKIGDPYQIT